MSLSVQHSPTITQQLNTKPLAQLFFFGGVTATAPSRDLTDNKKKEKGGLKQRRKQEEAAQGDPEPGKGNQENNRNADSVNTTGMD